MTDLDFASLYPHSLDMSSFVLHSLTTGIDKLYVKMPVWCADGPVEAEMLLDMKSKTAVIFNDSGEDVLAPAFRRKLLSFKDELSVDKLVQVASVAGVLTRDGAKKCIKNRYGFIDDSIVSSKFIEEQLELEYAIKTGKSPKRVRFG